jgi:hypothetical protein
MGFFATFWSWLNGQLATYIGNNTARLATALEPAVVTMAVIYVMAWGYLHLTGQIEEPFVAGLKRIILPRRSWAREILSEPSTRSGIAEAPSRGIFGRRAPRSAGAARAFSSPLPWSGA